LDWLCFGIFGIWRISGTNVEKLLGINADPPIHKISKIFFIAFELGGTI